MTAFPRWIVYAWFSAGWMRARYASTGERLAKADRRYKIADAKFRTAVFEL